MKQIAKETGYPEETFQGLAEQIQQYQADRAPYESSVEDFQDWIRERLHQTR